MKDTKTTKTVMTADEAMKRDLLRLQAKCAARKVRVPKKGA